MTAKLQDLKLRHVDPTKLFFQQRHPGLPDSQPEPEWFTAASSGGINFSAWWQGTVLARLGVKTQKDAYFAVVEVFGVFMSDEQARAQDASPSYEIDPSTLHEASAEELDLFAEQAIRDLYPFVRSELYTLSGRIQGVFGVMLQPQPKLGPLVDP